MFFKLRNTKDRKLLSFVMFIHFRNNTTGFGDIVYLAIKLETVQRNSYWRLSVRHKPSHTSSYEHYSKNTHKTSNWHLILQTEHTQFKMTFEVF